MSFRSFLFGMVFGAVATAGVFVLRAPDAATAFGAGTPPPAPPVAQLAPPPDVAPPAAASRPAPPPPAPAASIEFKPGTQPLRIGGDPRPQPTPRPAPTGPVTPIALSEEHAKLLAPPHDAKRQLSLPELHQQILSETKDPAWAPELEQAIRQALNASNGTAEFEIMNVECRATLCEVLAFGNQPSSGDRWNRLWDEMARQSWYSQAQITGNSSSTFTRNNRFVIITVLQRGRQR
jgi:hypothetical protein